MYNIHEYKKENKNFTITVNKGNSPCSDYGLRREWYRKENCCIVCRLWPRESLRYWDKENKHSNWI